MFKNLLPAVSLILLFVPAPKAVETAPTMKTERYYGKITEINPANQAITLHNARKKESQTFTWDDKTQAFENKQKINPGQLQVGQSLVVSYVRSGSSNQAIRVSVRPAAFKKKPTN